MVKDRVGSLGWLRKRIEDADKDLLREMVKAVTEVFMSAEASAVCGAPYRQPSTDRVNRRNGYRERRWDTRVGTIDLAIPKLRKGTYFPEWLLKPRRRAERALMQVVTECYVRGGIHTASGRAGPGTGAGRDEPPRVFRRVDYLSPAPATELAAC